MPELSLLEQTIRRQQGRYLGKFRGFVTDNADPDGRARVRLRVPSVLGDAESDWAIPAFPYGGANGLGFLMVPPVGAQCLVEFIEGDLSSPVWCGTYWRESDERPEEAATADPTVKLIKTDSGHLMMFEDADGSEAITVKSKAEAEIKMDENGSLALTDPNGATVTIDASGNSITVADSNGNEIVLSSDGIKASDANGNEIKMSASGVDVKGQMIKIEGSQVVLGGSGGEPLIKGTSFMTVFNTHVHTTTAPGAPTSPPMTPMTPGQLTTKTTAS